jgi:hypothetical protein
LGDNTLGFEDLLTGGDLAEGEALRDRDNDLVLKFDFA